MDSIVNILSALEGKDSPMGKFKLARLLGPHVRFRVERQRSPPKFDRGFSQSVRPQSMDVCTRVPRKD